jgi:acylphosphatase
MSEKIRTVHLRIDGRVQGVGYRAFVERQALALGLSGWVRNRHDGSVEAVLQGEPGPVAAIFELCRSGPAAARVDRVEIVGEGVGAYDGFEVRPSG